MTDKPKPKTSEVKETKQEKCPWDVCPVDIEEAVSALRALTAWEKKNGPAPTHWKPVISVSLMLDILERLQMVEDQVLYTVYDGHVGYSRQAEYSFDEPA